VKRVSDDGIWRHPDMPRMGDMLPRRVQLAARHGVTVICLVQTLSGLGHQSAGNRVLSLLLVVLLGLAWSVVATRRRGDALDIAAVIATVGLGAWLGVLSGNGQAYVTGYAALFVAPFWYQVPRALLPWACAVASVTFSTMFVGHRDITGGIGNGVGATFFGLAALFWGRVLRSSQANAELVLELRDSRDAEQRSAIVAERARLARELHDVLAHTLSSLSLHLESTRVLARSRDVDTEVQERIERAVALARDGLEEARDAVGTLRDDELPTADRLPSLIADFERSTGVQCRFEQVGTTAPLSPEASVALFRAAQEALTNIGKHARATRVDVSLVWNDGTVTLHVSNDDTGGPDGSVLPGGGNGLRGMRERAELAGGELDAGPTDRGFAVELRLPA
jgi:signal transduction histidine kinase